MKPVKTLRPRTVVLPQGELTFSRLVHECSSCRRSCALLDEELGVPPRERYTRSVRELVCWHASRSSCEDAAATLAHCHNLHVSSSEVARIAHEDGERIARAQEALEERWSEPVHRDTPVFPPEIQTEDLILQIDGTVVLTRKGEEHKVVWCIRGFDASARTDNGGKPPRPLLLESRYGAGAGTLEEFKSKCLALANRLGARGARRIAVVADGADPLWNLVKECFPGAIPIQDIWHVTEHLHSLARDLHGQGSEEESASAGRWRALLEAGKIDRLLADLEALRRKRRGEKRKRIAEEIAYLEKGKHRMAYPEYAAAGWPIGSGAIEGACKHLVKQRFNITGARWRRDQIEDVLALRVAQFNGEWDRHWIKQAA